MPSLETYKAQVRIIINEFERAVPVINKLRERDLKNEHKIIGNLVITPLMNYLGALLSMAEGDSELNDKDLEELVLEVGRSVKQFIEKHFGKLGIALLETHYKHFREKRDELVNKALKEILRKE